MPYGLYGYGGPEDDERRSLLEQLLGGSDIPMPAAPMPPPQHSMGRNIVGSLGDALLSAASVRAGGGPQAIGPYTAQRREADLNYQRRLEQHAERVAEAEQANRVLKRQGIIALMQEERANRPYKSEFTRDVDGQPHRIRQLVTPQGEIIREEDLGLAGYAQPVTDYVDPTTGAARKGTVNRATGSVNPIRAGGLPVGAIPPAGVVSSHAADVATVEGIDTMESAYQKIRQHIKAEDQSRLTQVVGTKAGETRYGGMLAPAYAEYTASRRASLNAYVKSVTGAQFSVAELDRYEGMYPEPWDDEALAAKKIGALKQRAVTDMREKQRLYPTLGGSQQTASPSGMSPAAQDWLRRRGGKVKP